VNAARLSMTRCRLALVACAATAAMAAPAVAAPDIPGARPGDDALTCDQIATELLPYMQQIRPTVQAVATTQQQLNTQALAVGEKRKVEHELLLPLATAGALDPTGSSKRAYQAAVMAQAAKEHAENEAMANSALAKQSKSQGDQMAAQAQAMQSDARLQRLMQLGQQKGCTKK